MNINCLFRARSRPVHINMSSAFRGWNARTYIYGIRVQRVKKNIFYFKRHTLLAFPGPPLSIATTYTSVDKVKDRMSSSRCVTTKICFIRRCAIFFLQYFTITNWH